MDQTQTLDPRKPVRTRSGYAARIICIDRADTFPIMALFTRPDNGAEQLIAAGADGRITHEEHPLDLVNVPESEATYPVNPLVQLLADPNEDEFKRLMVRVRDAIALHNGELDDTSVALAIAFGMMQEVRARVSLPIVFTEAVQELVRLRAEKVYPLERVAFGADGMFMPRMWDVAHAVVEDDTRLDLKAIAASHGYEARYILTESPDELVDADIAEKIAGTPVPDPVAAFGDAPWTLVARWESEDGEIVNWFVRPMPSAKAEG